MHTAAATMSTAAATEIPIIIPFFFTDYSFLFPWLFFSLPFFCLSSSRNHRGCIAYNPRLPLLHCGRKGTIYNPFCQNSSGLSQGCCTKIISHSAGTRAQTIRRSFVWETTLGEDNVVRDDALGDDAARVVNKIFLLQGDGNTPYCWYPINTLFWTLPLRRGSWMGSSS